MIVFNICCIYLIQLLINDINIIFIINTFNFIFLNLFSGSDPASQLTRFAKEHRGSSTNLDIISLGKW